MHTANATFELKIENGKLGIYSNQSWNSNEDEKERKQMNEKFDWMNERKKDAQTDYNSFYSIPM